MAFNNSRCLLKSLSYWMFGLLLSLSFGPLQAMERGHSTENEKDPLDLVPSTWSNNFVFVPSLSSSLQIISSNEIDADSTEVVVRYTVKNDGDEDLDMVQLSFDVASQFSSSGVTFFRTGSLTAMTGSGSVFATGSSTSLFGGMINPLYDGSSVTDILDPTASLSPNECIAVDIPIVLGNNDTGFDVEVTATSSASPAAGGAVISSTTSPIIVSSGCQSESLACAGRVNVSLNKECIGVVNLNTVFLNGNKNPLRYSVEVYYNGVSIGDTVRAEHVGKELTFRVLDGCFDNRVSCWGTVNVENKNIPEEESSYSAYMCSEDFAELPSLEDILKEIEEGCYADVYDLRETYTTSGDKCVGILTERVVTAKVNLVHEGVRTVTIRRDSIFEMPIDPNSIEAPLGGPLVTDAIKIACGEAPDGNPSPEWIKDYFDALPATTGSGTAYGYPHLDKGFRVDSTITTRDTIIERVEPTRILVDSVWVLFNVVVKDTTTIDVVTYDTLRNLIPIERGTTCNLQTKFTDLEYESCAGPETKIKRTWTILNWCGGTITEFDQWILIVDEEGPAIDSLPNLIATLVPWECSAEVQLSATAIDECSEVASEQWITSHGFIDEDGILKDITVADGDITVSYTATDGCGNDSTVTFIVNVIDNIKPVAIAEDLVNATIIYDALEQRGIAKVSVDAIDAGSHDSDCGPVMRCILLDEELENPLYFRDGSPAVDADGNQLYEALQCDYDGIFLDTLSEDKGTYEIVEVPYVICKEYVKFCCGDQGTQRVALVISDQSPNSEDGISWSDVLVEDKSTTNIVCETITVECGYDYSPESVGYPNVVFGICGGGDLTYVDVEDIDGCGEGRITRQWFIDEELACEQLILISGAAPFDPQNIKWPKHYTDESVSGFRRECVNDTMEYTPELVRMGDSFTCDGDALDEPTWCQTTCSLLAVSHEDQEVAADGACRKIVRHWTIIDWCNYTPNGSNPDVDNESFIAINDEWLEGDHPANIKDEEPCETCEKPSGDIGDIYFRYGNDVDVDGYYTYQQIIKIEDDTAPEIDAPVLIAAEIRDGAQSKNDTFEDCIGDIDVTANAVELCGNVLVDPSTLTWLIEVYDDEGNLLSTRNETGASATVNSQQGSYDDRHIIKWYVNDGCGNESYTETIVTFEDKKAPTPVCIRTISTATMNNDEGSVTIWAEDFDLGSYDNCGPVKVFFKDEDENRVNSLTFTCEDIPNGVNVMRELQMWVADDHGNEDFCYVTLRIDDTNNVCSDTNVESAAIGGNVITHKGDNIENARVLLNTQDESYTDVNGEFAFANNELFSSYKLVSQKNDAPLNGVTTLDLVMIQRHILAIQRFDSPYQIIAGDVNADTRISSIDLVQLRSLILGRTLSFPNNESWRFLNPDQEWENPLVPFPFVEEVVIESLSDEMMDQDFVGVKIGDVNGNAIANSLLAEGRSAGRLTMLSDDQYINAGQKITIPIRISDDIDLVGYQMTLETQGASIIDITAENVIGDYDKEVINENVATMAWYSVDALAPEESLIYVTVVGQEGGYISNMINVSDAITKAAAYDADLNELDIRLSFENAIVEEAQFELMQNTPNPFADQTTIGFVLPSKGNATLQVSDMTGKIVKEVNENFASGYNEITISRSDLNASGIYYYEITSGQYSATRKLIVLD